MKNFKHIDIKISKPLYKLIETSNGTNDFKMQFIYDGNKVSTTFIKKFVLDDLTLWEKIKYCYKILFNKKIELSSDFEFINGEHVVDISDLLFIYSRNIRKNKMAGTTGN